MSGEPKNSFSLPGAAQRTCCRPKRNGLTVGLLSGLVVMALLAGCRTAGPHAARLKTWQAANPVWRGVHLNLHSDAQAAQLKEALPQFAAIGVNVLIVEVNYNFEFRSHPELRDSPCLSRAGARELARAAQTQGIRLIPELNCLGHQSWSKTTAPLLAHYPQFDETPGQFPNNQGIYCRSWCPQNPEVNRVVFALMDELIEAFEADAFHVGMDEVFLIGSDYCPRCRGVEPARLFAQAVNDLHRHIVGERHLEMLMWGDRLLDAKALGYTRWEAATNGTAAAIDRVPKDIIVCDWHYGQQTNYPSVPWLLQKGFRVWPAGWQPVQANLAFSAFARQQHHPRLLGYLCTTWSKTSIPEAAAWPPIAEVLPQWQ